MATILSMEALTGVVPEWQVVALAAAVVGLIAWLGLTAKGWVR